jgi:DNA (cytosine-5)-methyltransferase 1
MADGARQTGFNFPHKDLVSHLRPGEVVIDFFAGGGGASEALEQALGRPVDLAVNHDEFAIGMHAANHPYTKHLREDVWHVDPRLEVGRTPVGWFHASPDCTHFSQARGGQPRSRKTRALSWVVVKWVGALAKTGNAPRLISLENVEQILKWGPLVAKRDKATGRVLKMDGTVAARGERVPVEQQQLVPDKRHEGRTWAQFVAILRAHGYAVDWRKLVASDYGAGTSRKRLFLIARNDGEPIQWPEPTHGPGRQPVITAGDCIDWSIPCPSIFTRGRWAWNKKRGEWEWIARPLADATLRRIARGIRRYVLDAAEPFIVQCANASANGVHSSEEPLGVVTAWPRGGSYAVVAPTLVQTGYGEREGQAPRVPGLDKPLGTLVDGQKHAAVAAHLVKFRGDSAGSAAGDPMPTITSGAGAARPAGAAHAMGVVTAFLEQAAGGPNSNTSRPRGADEPVSTISTKGSQQRLVAVHLQHASTSNTNGGRGRADLPLRTIMAGGQHHAVVECTLSPEHEAGALRVAAFLLRYHSTGGQDADLRDPLTTVTTKDRLALVTVVIRGTPYVIVDIGLRMLQRNELFKAQGFPPSYIIDRTADGRRLTVSQSVRMVGNSVSPPPLLALARANLPTAEPLRKAA